MKGVEGAVRGRRRTSGRHGEEAPGVARVIALKLPPCKNTPSKRVPTSRARARTHTRGGGFASSCLISSRIRRDSLAESLRDVSCRRAIARHRRLTRRAPSFRQRQIVISSRGFRGGVRKMEKRGKGGGGGGSGTEGKSTSIEIYREIMSAQI